MRIELFDYQLPQELIAQRPANPRDSSRLLVLDPPGGELLDRNVSDLPGLIPSGALLVVNDTRVIPARLLGHKAQTGGKVEILLVRKLGDEPIPVAPGKVVTGERWRTMGKASKTLKFPSVIEFDHGLIARLDGRGDDDGLLDVVLFCADGSPVAQAIQKIGRMPLPPYIRRDDDAADRGTYQTVYARVDGAVAAPTAGLHITNRLLGMLSAAGVKVATVTLHVGPGTFLPVTSGDLDDHRMHEEWFEVPRFTASEIEQARLRGSPVVAVGTTTVRALEAAADDSSRGHVRACAASTRLLIQPGYRFRVVDAMLTNFHLPKSTLLALVAAFAGRENMMAAYAHAVKQQYRFYSYGDAMFIKGRAPVPA